MIAIDADERVNQTVQIADNGSMIFEGNHGVNGWFDAQPEVQLNLDTYLLSTDANGEEQSISE